jgi:AraC-like DNA-binding protein
LDSSGEIALSAGRHLSELIHLVVAELNDRPPEPESQDLAATRLSVALSLLRTSFRRPDASVTWLAASQNISARYLHRLLEQAGIRFTRHLNELRLTAACEALRQQKDKPITVIAMESGFSDISHFNRLFKKRFGVTPSAMRGRKTDG